MNRPDWHNYFINIANVVATRSTCIRSQYGAVIVSPTHDIVATGYNGAPSGVISCHDRGVCLRDELGIESGTRYETCYSVHAEANAIIRAGRSVRNCDLYIGSVNQKNNTPCFMCRRLMANAGINICRYMAPDGMRSELLRDTSMRDLRCEAVQPAGF